MGTDRLHPTGLAHGELSGEIKYSPLEMPPGQPSPDGSKGLSWIHRGGDNSRTRRQGASSLGLSGPPGVPELVGMEPGGAPGPSAAVLSKSHQS